MSAWEVVTLMGGVFVGSFLVGTLFTLTSNHARRRP